MAQGAKTPHSVGAVTALHLVDIFQGAHASDLAALLAKQAALWNTVTAVSPEECVAIADGEYAAIVDGINRLIAIVDRLGIAGRFQS